MVSSVVTKRLKEEPVQDFELFCRAWDECEELQANPKEVWVGRTLALLSSIDRYEIYVARDSKVIGAVALAYDFDVHVGDCMSVVAQYVYPEYRNTGVSMSCMRQCLRITKELGYQYLAFTHRVGTGRYETIYKGINSEITKD